MSKTKIATTSLYHDEAPPLTERREKFIIPSSSKRAKIVVIGGGTGAFSVLSGLKKYPVDLTAIVSMVDDGSSTGILREEFGVLPPGDIRRVLIAMSHSDNRVMANLFNYRFNRGSGLNGHSFGNLILTALENVTGSFKGAVEEAGRLLGVQGRVLPVTFDDVRLCAELEDGKIIKGQTNIDIPKHDGRLRIKKVYLEPSLARINKEAGEAIQSANLIIIGPGDLYTSIVPNLLVRGMKEAISRSRAKKVYVVNIMTKWGETHNFKADDFIKTIEGYMGKKLDYALVNTRRPAARRKKLYEKERAQFVKVDNVSEKPSLILGDFLRSRGFLRHDPEKLAKALISLV